MSARFVGTSVVVGAATFVAIIAVSCRKPPTDAAKPDSTRVAPSDDEGSDVESMTAIVEGVHRLRQEDEAACAECHADQVQRLSGSHHALAARAVLDADPPIHADFTWPDSLASLAGPGASVEVASRPSQVVADEHGQVLPRPVLAVIGGARREDFVTPHVSSPSRVLPLAWSVTARRWTTSVAEGSEEPRAVTPDSPAWWTAPARRASACSRCHPLAEDRAERGPHGIGCAACHGATAKHVRAARDVTSASQPIDRKLIGSGKTDDAWGSCGRCHARGLPLAKGDPPNGKAPNRLTDHVLPSTLSTPLGFNPSYLPDGRPSSPHGYEVQALAQSACFRKGGATCTTCHDPHGPAPDSPQAAVGSSLRDADPDASCRKCHAKEAAAPAQHAHHPVTSTPVPLALLEPGGPDPKRLPGCVDCHAPAILPFGEVDRVRDHAIDVPAPDVLSPNACTTCHATWPEKRLVDHLDKHFPSRSDRRKRWARAFSLATVEGTRPGMTEDEPKSVKLLVGVLDDPEADPWTRSSAAELLGGFGPRATSALPALKRALSSDDPLLVRRAARAIGMLGAGGAEDLATIAKGTDDWRVELEAAAGLAILGDPRGLERMESLRQRKLSTEARANVSFEMGLALLGSGAVRRGELLFEEALTLDPEHVGAWLNLGVSRVSRGDAAGAVEAWTKVLELAPDNPFAKANLETFEQVRADAEKNPPDDP